MATRDVSIKYSLVHDGINALEIAYIIPSFRSFPNVAIETVQCSSDCVTMFLSRPFKEDCLALPLSVDGVMSLALCPQVVSKLQALVYDILPSTTAVFSYAIAPQKLSANEQFFVFVFVCFLFCSNSSKFVTNNSNYIRRLF